MITEIQILAQGYCTNNVVSCDFCGVECGFNDIRYAVDIRWKDSSVFSLLTVLHTKEQTYLCSNCVKSLSNLETALAELNVDTFYLAVGRLFTSRYRANFVRYIFTTPESKRKGGIQVFETWDWTEFRTGIYVVQYDTGKLYDKSVDLREVDWDRYTDLLLTLIGREQQIKNRAYVACGYIYVKRSTLYIDVTVAYGWTNGFDHSFYPLEDNSGYGFQYYVQPSDIEDLWKFPRFVFENRKTNFPGYAVRLDISTPTWKLNTTISQDAERVQRPTFLREVY